MIEQKAKVVAIDEQTIWLEAERQSTCSGCAVKKGCGTGLLENHIGKRFSRIAVTKQQNVTLEQEMQLAIPEEALLYSAFMMYIVPLVLMFLFAAGAQWLAPNVAIEIFSGVTGLALGLYWVHRCFKNKKIGIEVKVVEEIK